jgi:hypothetical protein
MRKRWRHVVENASQDTLRFYLALLFMICLAALFVSEQTLAILSANILSGSTVLSAEPQCGPWRPNVSAYDWDHGPGRYEAVLHENYWGRSMEERALAYARNCYGGGEWTGSCNTLASRQIRYNVIRNAPCPFLGEVCVDGPTSALEMDTGYQSISALGFNAPVSGFFRRKSICSPLSTNSSYTRLRLLGNNYTTAYWEYLYGWPKDTSSIEVEPLLWSQPLQDATRMGFQLK